MGRKERRAAAAAKKETIKKEFLDKLRKGFAHAKHGDEIADLTDKIEAEMYIKHPPQTRALVAEAVREFKQTDEFGKTVEQALVALATANAG